jgi:hypothetical protein
MGYCLKPDLLDLPSEWARLSSSDQSVKVDFRLPIAKLLIELPTPKFLIYDFELAI